MPTTSEDVVQLPPDGQGKKLRAQTGGAMPVGTYAEVLALQDSTGVLVDPAHDATVAAISTSLGTDGTTPPALPGGSTGVRGWLRLIWAVLSGTLTVQFPAAQPVTVSSIPEVEVKNDVGNPLAVSGTVSSRDQFTSAEILADQAGAGAVLTFTFANGPVELIWVTDTSTLTSAISRVDPFGGVPAAALGIPVFNATPTPVACPPTSSVKVYAPAGTNLVVYGCRY